MRKKVAIFDIDGTIFRKNLLTELVLALIDEEIFSTRVKRELNREYSAWLDRRGSHEDFINKEVIVYQKYIKGHSQREVKKVAASVLKHYHDRVYRYTRDLINRVRPEYHLIAVSGSPIEIVQEYNKYLKFDVAFGTIFEIDKNGVYTGKVEFKPAEDKRGVVDIYLDKKRLTLGGSIGIGDTEADIAFLSRVSRSIAFNPNRILYDYARKKNWEIVVERKDVTYDLTRQDVIKDVDFRP